MTGDYFSDRERGPRERSSEQLGDVAWGGLLAMFRGLLANGAFGDEFPELCPDGEGVCGNNECDLGMALQAEIPGIRWPLSETVPDTLDALDLLEFCHRCIAEPTKGAYHSYYRHHHLGFDREAGQPKFREKVNRILSRSGLAFHLTADGEVQRLAAPGLREALARASFDTGDATLDRLLGEARRKFLKPDPAVRREALEKLWDAWERLKTIVPADDKKQSTVALLAKAVPEGAFRVRVDNEARELTAIGNSFHIRHTETTQTPLREERDVDYLFHRLFALIQFLLRGLKG